MNQVESLHAWGVSHLMDQDILVHHETSWIAAMWDNVHRIPRGHDEHFATHKVRCEFNSFERAVRAPGCYLQLILGNKMDHWNLWLLSNIAWVNKDLVGCISARPECMKPRAGNKTGCIEYNEMIPISFKISQLRTPCCKVRLCYPPISVCSLPYSPGQTSCIPRKKIELATRRDSKVHPENLLNDLSCLFTY